MANAFDDAFSTRRRPWRLLDAFVDPAYYPLKTGWTGYEPA
jgi:hypothetical protein